MITEYSHVKVPLNTVLGGTVQALSTKNGTTLTRVTEDGRDDLVVCRPGKPEVHLAWVQVKGGIVQAPVSYGPSRSEVEYAEAKAVAEEEERLALEKIAADGGPKDDTVRVTRRKKAAT